MRATYTNGGWSQYASEHDLPLETPDADDDLNQTGEYAMTSLAWKVRTAWVEITGKVFVAEDEILDELRTIYPSKVRYDNDLEDWIDETSEAEKQVAFLRLAEQKARDLLGNTDDPLKLYTLKLEEYR